MKYKKILIFLTIFNTTLYTSELTAMQKACDKGVATACYEISLIYNTFEEKEKKRQSYNYLEKSCDYGYEVACKKLNVLYKSKIKKTVL